MPLKSRLAAWDFNTVPERIAKRAVSACKTARFAAQNGTFQPSKRHVPQRIGSQRVARRAVLDCKTARFGLRNGPKREPKRPVSQANSAPVAKPWRQTRLLVAYMQASHAKLLKAARRQQQGPEPWRGAATGRRHCKRLHNKYKPRANRVATIFVILRAENNRKNLGTGYGKNMEMVWQERQDNACHA